MIVWGKLSDTSSSVKTIKYPISFTSKAIMASNGAFNSGGYLPGYLVPYAVGTTGFNVVGHPNVITTWIVIGW